MPKSPITPGTALKNLMDEYQVNPTRLAKEIAMSQSAIRQIVIGRTGISIPTALRLAKYFGTTPDYWISLQTGVDIFEAGKDAKLSAVIKAIQKGKRPVKKNVDVSKVEKKIAKKIQVSKPRKP
jgi:addiction module HigA family antidote